MFILSQKPLRKCRKFFSTFFLHSSEKLVWKSGDFYKTCLHVGKFAFAHTFTFHHHYFNKFRYRWHIYLKLHQIWLQSEQFATASERHPWHHLLVITGLLTYSRFIILPLFLLEENAILQMTAGARAVIASLVQKNENLINNSMPYQAELKKTDSMNSMELSFLKIFGYFFLICPTNLHLWA